MGIAVVVGISEVEVGLALTTGVLVALIWLELGLGVDIVVEIPVAKVVVGLVSGPRKQNARESY